MPMTQDKINDIFSYHAPKPEQVDLYAQINAAFVECASKVNQLMPDGAGATAAIRKLAEARMACNAAVALEGRF